MNNRQSIAYPAGFENNIKDMIDIIESIKHIDRKSLEGTSDQKFIDYLNAADKRLDEIDAELSMVIGIKKPSYVYIKYIQQTFNRPMNDNNPIPRPNIGKYSDLALLIRTAKTWVNNGYMLVLPVHYVDSNLSRKQPVIVLRDKL